jgi:hypothetical protein
MASARRQARRAAEQAGPMTASARTAARGGVYDARVWAAPRLDRTAYALEDQVAPRMAAMLSAAAQRIEPAPVRRRRRWPVLAAGLITAAGLGAAAAYLLKRRGAANTTPGKETGSAAGAAADPAEVPIPPGRQAGQRAGTHS